ncbi:2-keto-4-methylthiobutyrate aminotransferase (plasmid) [Azospirillum argentinense]|uniref:Probable branched-chain-amino-acid aminotransferase n=1 Tax=Azospirillum argentinense TaxID=2970906 RepID=A0A2K1FW09_9PROT|nr:aminotransferase class IV [Azospirillum argentinense]AIB15500.1 2-keto-4-methylthiobutyrate aminotransferase [Azospirillum argentinense]EZQ04282.1 2-keto-4-methylthiobutyrate aminotransferase [Azospirillum argentinense]KAA1057242.1 Aminodeoxychorismate lyase [Azospirillum argentinense]PNQ96731.1 2-keto-4-methylthiobutyrate aminotransferase [Azospirillum argentinense]
MTVVWLNGRLLSAEEARIDPADRGFTLGDGLFETIRVAGGTACHLDRHLARLADSAALLGLPLPHDAAALAAAEALIAAQGCVEGVLRITLTRGTGARGVLPPVDAVPTLLMTLAPAPPPAGPVEAVIARVTRRNEHSPLSRVKSLNYLDSILARQEAATRGAGEALLLNSAGRLAESSVANLFIVRDGRLLTPPVTEGALPGIRRALILERGDASEAPLSVADLLGAGEAFLTNSLGVRPLLRVDGQIIGAGTVGPVTAALLKDIAAE